MTESQEFGCTVEASSFLGTVGSSPLIFVIGVSSIKDVSLVKYDINTTDLYYTRKAGKITKILIEYEAPFAGIIKTTTFLFIFSSTSKIYSTASTSEAGF